jgi:hypothetical protein
MSYFYNALGWLKEKWPDMSNILVECPGLFCTSSDERDWTMRSGIWRRARSIPLNRL